MKTIDQVKEKMQACHGILSTQQLLDIRISRTTLTHYVQKGVLVRCGHGYYTLPDSLDDDIYLLSLRSKHVIFSHETALFLNGLSERTPFFHAVTIPSNACMPAAMKEQCKCYYIQPDLHELGAAVRETTFGNKVRCYDAERTVCDILRSRNRMDDETVISALKLYVEKKDKNLNNLGKYAEAFHISGQVRHYMEVLL